ncbi:MAG: DUF2852 domain-containing protein [Maritimibacter sp.]|nr:DUF2852 domain-containing protein [Maritimibacter sp.]
MTFALDYEPRKSGEGWFRRAEGWLDDRGKPAWIAAMVLGFIAFWPIGLALLFYMIFGKRMFGHSCTHRRHRHGFDHDAMHVNRRHNFRSSGNTAFDAYKAETLKRLMDEQEQFEAFLDRLRAAKDKREFDTFMDERADAARHAHDDADEADEVEPRNDEPRS